MEMKNYSFYMDKKEMGKMSDEEMKNYAEEKVKIHERGKEIELVGLAINKLDLYSTVRKEVEVKILYNVFNSKAERTEMAIQEVIDTMLNKYTPEFLDEQIDKTKEKLNQTLGSIADTIGKIQSNNDINKIAEDIRNKGSEVLLEDLLMEMTNLNMNNLMMIITMKKVIDGMSKEDRTKMDEEIKQLEEFKNKFSLSGFKIMEIIEELHKGK